MSRIPITPLGKKKLEKELERLLKVERPSVIAAIAEARSHGDLSENAEYEAAKERQSFVEGRIQEINGKMAMIDVIDPTTIKSDSIKFGATVKLKDIDEGKILTYQIVGETEANVSEGLISVKTPIAQALIGKKEGDEVEIHSPRGERYLEVLQIKYE